MKRRIRLSRACRGLSLTFEQFSMPLAMRYGQRAIPLLRIKARKRKVRGGMFVFEFRDSFLHAHSFRCIALRFEQQSQFVVRRPELGLDKDRPPQQGLHAFRRRTIQR